MNHVHNDDRYLVSVIILLVGNGSGRDTTIYDGVLFNDLNKISHVIKSLHGRFFLGLFERCICEGTIWRVNRSVI